MDSFSQLMTGFGDALTPENLLLALIGVTLGTLVGVLPGIGPALTVALLLPITFTLEPTGALILFAGIYYGGMYGGSTTAILLNTPGESASMVAALEGNKMARSGRASGLTTAPTFYLLISYREQSPCQKYGRGSHATVKERRSPNSRSTCVSRNLWRLLHSRRAP